MRIIETYPQYGGTISAQEAIKLVFDKDIDASTFSTGMVTIQSDAGTSITYTYEIQASQLILRPNFQQTGQYQLAFTPFDFVSGQILSSTDGDACNESLYLAFTVEASGSVQIDTDIMDAVDTLEPQTMEFKQVVVGNTFSVKFDKQIQAPFEARIVVDRFDGDEYDETVTVTEDSSFAKYTNTDSGAVVTVTFDAPLENAIVYMLMDVSFTDGSAGHYEAIQFGRLKPYINTIHIRNYLGQYSSSVQDDQLYYAILKQMVELEYQTGKRIIGQNIEPQEKVFIMEYQKLELAKMLSSETLVGSGMSLDLGAFSISVRQTNSTIDQLQQSIIKQYILFNPKVASRSLSYDETVHTRARQQLKLYEEYMQRAQVAVNTAWYSAPAGFYINAET